MAAAASEGWLPADAYRLHAGRVARPARMAAISDNGKGKNTQQQVVEVKITALTARKKAQDRDDNERSGCVESPSGCMQSCGHGACSSQHAVAWSGRASIRESHRVFAFTGHSAYCSMGD